jgi:4-hydroxythreonine-4-phosphate dehydrogenase
VRRASNTSGKPRIGITIGDPAGIGPEIVLKAASSAEIRETCVPILIGSAAEIVRQAAALRLPFDYQVSTDFDFAPLAEANQPTICDTGSNCAGIQFGAVSSVAGRAAIDAIDAGARLCWLGKLDALATAPINKEALKLAGSPFPGHTEMLASICGVDECLMCFFAGDLKVFLLSIHMSLSDAIKSITRERVRSALILADRELRRFGVSRPRIAVAGLNPHAGEHGLFGTEEMQEIGPAISDCKSNHNIDASGPFPADTLFVRAARGEFDAVAACYHDQGLIAVKCMAFGEAVNVTLGLPIIRTSVDHGTAFDIAGRGIADHRSMIEAIKLAASLVERERLSQSDAAATQNR